MLLHASVIAMATGKLVFREISVYFSLRSEFNFLSARMSEIVPAKVATKSSGSFCIGCSNATNGQIPWQV